MELFKRKVSPEDLHQQRDMWAARRAAAECDAAKLREATTELALEAEVTPRSPLSRRELALPRIA